MIKYYKNMDLDKTKNRKWLLYPPTILIILLLILVFIEILCNYKESWSFILYIITVLYFWIVAMVIFIHDVRKQNKKYRND